MFTLFGPEGDFKEIVKSQDRRKRQKRRDERKWGGNQVDSQAAWWRAASECVRELNRFFFGGERVGHAMWLVGS